MQHIVAQEAPRISSLDPLHRADLEKSGLSAATIEAMGIRSHDTTMLHGLLEWASLQSGVTGYAIPYFDLSGARTTHCNFRLFPGPGWRQAGGTKWTKYAKPTGSQNALYCPLGLNALLATSNYCLITEGEKKAAKAVQEGIPCVAIAGVWNWCDSGPRGAEKASGQRVDFATKPLDALIDLAVKQQKKIVLLFDSDLDQNKDVAMALRALRDALLYHGASWVQKLSMPEPTGLETNGKIGLDDLLLHPDGRQQLDQALQQLLQKKSAIITPFLRFPYATTSDGRPLYYTVANARRHAHPHEKCIFKEIESPAQDGTLCIESKIVAKTRIWMRRTITDIDSGQTHFEAAYVPMHGDRPKYLRGGPELLLTGAGKVGDPYAAYNAAILPNQRLPLSEFLLDCQSGGQTKAVDGSTRRGWISYPKHGAPLFLTANIAFTSEGAVAADHDHCPLVPVPADHLLGSQGYEYAARGDERLLTETLLNQILIHPLPAVICGAAVASLLRHWCPKSENFILHLYGDSSHGKTTCLRAAASIFGEPKMLIDTWRSTSNGLEGKLVSRNDLPVFLDEAGQQDNPKVLAEAAYLIGNEKQKMRANRYGAAQHTTGFRVVALSTGEKTLLNGTGELSKAGQEVRLLQVPVNLDGRPWGGMDGSQIERLNAVLNENYGWILPRLIKTILSAEKNKPGLIATEMDRRLECFREHLPEGAPEHVRRRIKHCALIATGLYFLTIALLHDWKNPIPIEQASERCSHTYEFIVTYMLQLPSDEHRNSISITVLERLEAQIAANRNRLPVDIDDVNLAEIWGRTEGSKVVIIESMFKHLIGSMDKDVVLDALKRHDVIELASGGIARKTQRFGEATPKCYVINLKKLSACTNV